MIDQRLREPLLAVVLALALVACHRGDLGEKCNPNGTCNAQALRCLYGECSTWVDVPREDTCTTCAKTCGDAGVAACGVTRKAWSSPDEKCECRP